MSHNGNRVLTMPGVLMLSATLAYEEGNARAQSVVDRALALAAERGYTRAAEFRAAFFSIAAVGNERERQVSCVFEFINPHEFHRLVLDMVHRARQEEGGAA